MGSGKSKKKPALDAATGLVPGGNAGSGGGSSGYCPSYFAEQREAVGHGRISGSCVPGTAIALGGTSGGVGSVSTGATVPVVSSTPLTNCGPESHSCTLLGFFFY